MELTKSQKKNLLIIVLAVGVFLVLNALYQSEISFGIDFGEKYQSLPNYLMFLATIITGYIVYQTLVAQQETLNSQEKALEIQKKSNEIAAFENRFFKFIDYHRENVSTMKYRDPKTKEIRYWEGNQVFTVIYYEIKDLLEQYMKFKPVPNNSDTTRKAKAIDFVYQCVFWGSGVHSLPILKKAFNDSEFKNIIFIGKTAEYSTLEKPNVYYSGHARRLGHYFRNLYRAVKYVDEQKFLTEKQKYEYVTILRAQMSVYEQAVFFYNSISALGDVWEWESYREAYPHNEEEKKEVFKKLLITKYDFIRNTLNNDGVISRGININHFYPLINLERENEFMQVAVLPFNGNKESICRTCFNKKYIEYSEDEKKQLLIAKRGIERISLDGLPNTIMCDEKQCETDKTISQLTLLK